MDRALYLECYAGISGDMTVAALLDLGVDKDVLLQALKSLPLDGFEVEISRVNKAGLDACDFNVKLDSGHENHDHDMKYLHGHDHTEHNHNSIDHGHNHDGHDHNDTVYTHNQESHHHDHSHHHEHRGLPEIMHMIEHSQISKRAKEIAVNIFEILAQAESKAHGVPVSQVHFHEVGAVDSIVDIVAVAVCLDYLKITKVIVPAICEGTGTVRCQHGILPIPVPAVANIMREHHLPVQITNVKGELVTPTGAAIVAAIRTDSELPGQFTIEKIGIGAGKRQYERPSLLRIMMIQEMPSQKDVTALQKKENNSQFKSETLAEQGAADKIYKLETNVDDCTGETLGYVMERLFEAGARDVHYTPVFMKKNRPAYQLNVICDANQIGEMENIIFHETTTIGIRRVSMERTVLERETSSVKTDIGEVQVKKCVLPTGEVRTYPEYDSAIQLAREKKIPLRKVMETVSLGK